MEWLPYRTPSKDPTMEAIEAWHRRRDGGYVREGPPLLAPDHPAAPLIPGPKFSREDIRALFKALTGREPPETVEEFKAQMEQRRKEAWQQHKKNRKAVDPSYDEANDGDEPPDDWCRYEGFFTGQ